jgi:2-C-methyl-D-erythritol 4-phosphate cytidylyltransferase/2-C-methyl-D-erythritol 2,4-cyclodiphosphate synthase
MSAEKRPLKTIALLVAAGKSERMGGDFPKQYMPIAGVPLLRHTINLFLSHPQIDGVRVVIRREHHMLYRSAIEGLVLFPMVVGGEKRHDSVRLGLESLAHRDPQYVLVHDVARPLVSHKLISEMIEALKVHKGAVPALALTDSVKQGDGGVISKSVDRTSLYTVQTPQAFDYKTLLEAHQKHRGMAYTDDAALLEAAGVPVALVPGEQENFKITTKEDVERMQNLLALTMETRTGIGFDVHALKTHDMETPISQQYIKLCGIKIPFSYYLKGHSDADVGLHAMVDAILGAISAGDIGMHFPPDDPKWQGADSERFLLHAYELLKTKGGELMHLDVTLICERPKVSSYREQMVEHIAQTLKIDKSRVSVKATTTERLGFTGRGEGVAAQAVATVRLPRKDA